ncbi:hypothetical protein [Piscinibacter sp. XHJ-5]|uniref:hypothetical protein n=1 Tax=Piscinibacter sp. XHJ-5 TaxID=3037797 RepID=UPI0024533682|nr:hypothetical protein [Piscinibacter sp. XHJ-5]
MQRRSWLKLGFGAAALLALAGGGLALLKPGWADGRMTPAARSVFHAVARAVLDGSLPADAAQRSAALESHLERLDETLAGFPAATHHELSQLLMLLASPPGRVALAGLHTDWPDASVEQLQHALQGMRTSNIALRQQAYHALRDLTNAAYYAAPQIWALTGYPGPRDI